MLITMFHYVLVIRSVIVSKIHKRQLGYATNKLLFVFPQLKLCLYGCTCSPMAAFNEAHTYDESAQRS